MAEKRSDVAGTITDTGSNRVTMDAMRSRCQLEKFYWFCAHPCVYMYVLSSPKKSAVRTP